jgi:para-nitrobenzyl esterase
MLWFAACVGVDHSSAREIRQSPSCLVTTVGGELQGIDNGASCSFLGVPFAAPPVDALRWKPPQAAAPVVALGVAGHDTAA